jgi:chaperonin GroES
VEQTKRQATDLKRLLRIADMPNCMDEIEDVQKYGREVVRLTKVDDASREDWLTKSERGMKLALQVVDNVRTLHGAPASNVKYPLITVAAIQFHARAYPAIVNGNRVVQGQVTGADPEQQKLMRSARVAAHMNWQLLHENPDWEEDLDKLLLALPVEGCEFKKSFFSKDRGYNLSEWVRPEDFIINSKSKSIASSPRFTHRLWYYPHEIESKMISGVWSDEDLGISEQDSDDEVLQEFYEQHRYLDLDEDGLKEPYIITVHVKSEKVVRVAPCFWPENIVLERDGDEITLGELSVMLKESGLPPEEMNKILDSGKVVKVPRVEMFTKFSFLPSPDGSFYDVGFGQLIGPLSDSVDTNINQLIDAGTLSNQQGGFIQTGVNIGGRRGNVKFERGEFKDIKLPAGVTMNNAIYQVKFNEPSQVLFSLLGLLIQCTKDITSVQDIMTGAPSPQGEKATTTVARVDQGIKVFVSIYKRIYRALKWEFSLLYQLNAKYLKPQQYFKVLDNEMVAERTDYLVDNTDVQPVSDPQSVSSALSMVKYQQVLPFMSHPQVDDEKLLLRFFNAIEIPNPEELIIPKDKIPQGPSPEQQLEVMKAADAHVEMKARIVKMYSEVIRNLADAESKEDGAQIAAYTAQAQALRGLLDDERRGNAVEGAGPDQGVPGGSKAPVVGM